MKAKVNDTVRALVNIQSDLTARIIPAGTRGTVVECYTQPEEGYAIDFAIPDDNLVGGFSYDNTIVNPDDFEVLGTDMNPNG